ncbi:DotU family type IV/VI secretion system protein [Variovorax saccharolyticus]|uniref:DotU family type IV/VI secretion system protein n=1 Tax=Variovorax saccharolyticus TaxID=3053516 RepID=UPI002575443B|nr:DotU family type IV/VI secretion system protein [Variovorax sp. J31P216]MDM0029791.1 DotU family type IV/VI secretion system protein [Variovorax sp. J31P216]
MKTFADASLIDEMVRFATFVDDRLAALHVHIETETTHASRAERPLHDHPYEALIEGAYSDLTREVQKVADRVAAEHSELSADAVAEFKYLLAAWVDETLVRTFRELLPRSLAGAAEYRLFGTMDAGEQIFMKMDRAISRRGFSDMCLSSVYLLALALGFRGQYQEHTGTVELARYQRDLTQLALHKRIADDEDAPTLTAEMGEPLSSAPPLYKRAGLIWGLVAIVWLSAIVSMEALRSHALAPVRQVLLGYERAAETVPAPVAGEQGEPQ